MSKTWFSQAVIDLGTEGQIQLLKLLEVLTKMLSVTKKLKANMIECGAISLPA